MAQTRSTRTSAASKTPAEEPAPPAVAPVVLGRPVVLRYKKKKRKKRKKRFSRGLKDAQGLVHGMMRATERMADGGYRGARTLRKKSTRSARRKRDGGLRDLLKNSGLAMDDALSSASKAPYDVLRRVNTRYVWRQTRPFVESVYGITYPLNNFFR